MPFGKYRGWDLRDLPEDYLDWLEGLPDLRNPLARAVCCEVSRRQQEQEPHEALQRQPDAGTMAAAGELVAAGYRELAKRNHPDVGGDTATMQAVNAAAAWLRAHLREVTR